MATADDGLQDAAILLMSLGEEEAQALGVDTRRTRALAVGGATLVTASAVAVSGNSASFCPTREGASPVTRTTSELPSTSTRLLPASSLGCDAKLARNALASGE